jgi:hypothetical protein
MTKPYNPKEDKNLIGITLNELAKSDNIIYRTNYDSEKTRYKINFSESETNLIFYVEKKTNDKVPLKMQHFSCRGSTLVPNQPVGALTFEQDAFYKSKLFIFHKLGVLIPYTVEFNNIMCYPAVENSPYFENESGWKNKEQGKFLEARIDFIFNNEEIHKSRAITTVRYSL